MYRWDVTVRNWDYYGDKVVSKRSASIIAANRSEVAEKVRTMFEAKYDEFRKFWSHDAVIHSVCEEAVPDPFEQMNLPAVPVVSSTTGKEN